MHVRTYVMIFLDIKYVKHAKVASWHRGVAAELWKLSGALFSKHFHDYSAILRKRRRQAMTALWDAHIHRVSDFTNLDVAGRGERPPAERSC